jgi:hypothetical protein
MATKTKARKSAPAPEVEDDDDVELEDLDTEVADEDAPAAAANAVTFGVADLVKYLKEKHGVDTTPRELRTLIRKMAREDKPRVNRDIVPGNKSRYDWVDGIKDPEVKRIIAAVTKGEIDADKKAKLEQLKADKAKKVAAKKKAAAKKAAEEAEVEELDDDEDVEDVEFEDDDE